MSQYRTKLLLLSHNFSNVMINSTSLNESHYIDGEEVLQSGPCLVVESLELWFETFDCELLMDAAICFDPFRGGP
jgi:hypothetical protein